MFGNKRAPKGLKRYEGGPSLELLTVKELIDSPTWIEENLHSDRTKCVSLVHYCFY